MKNNIFQDNHLGSPIESAIVIDFPRRGMTKDMFIDILDQGIQSFEMRKSQKGMRLAVRDKNGKLQYFTSYFPYISAIRSFQDCRYFYAGKESELRLYAIKFSSKNGEMYTEEVKDNVFSLEEMVHEKYLGNGIIEFTILQQRSQKSDPFRWKTSFVDIHACQKYILNDFSFEHQAIFVGEGTTYLVGRSFDAYGTSNHSDINAKCAVVLSGENGKWWILGDKFLGNITPLIGTSGEIIGFEGPVQETDKTIKKYQILCGEEVWSRQIEPLCIVK